ncbi:DNA-binding MarR family transcriptional regulator [Paenibacillus cellulosilyticus]|uniref:DNA-binding MarR family transcriptional regulator n=1 Tax=Paenibacillus cellulosilyticus TaxID=375489 RepID=A0A2V2YT90_9BACL|nr:MarR family transcriptional regulator [Paenibacillus cellulosilyticus]PWV99459.1 DNA-binding MarR family transcriptional regulator [Paenibacillus cellulosilyticus]QKS44715.1 MarR family transcriptional regulator [Paenibacillus cellulosilyticus]
MYYKQLAKHFFDYMVTTNIGPMEPPDPKDYSRGEVGILIHLAFRKDGVTSGLLSEALHVSTGRIASALKTLEKKQLIERREDLSDKRRVNVFITDKGRSTILKKHEEAIERMEKSLEKLGEEDAKKFVELSMRFFS